MQDLFLTNYTDKIFLDKIKESFNRSEERRVGKECLA